MRIELCGVPPVNNHEQSQKYQDHNTGKIQRMVIEERNQGWFGSLCQIGLDNFNSPSCGGIVKSLLLDGKKLIIHFGIDSHGYLNVGTRHNVRLKAVLNVLPGEFLSAIAR